MTNIINSFENNDEIIEDLGNGFKIIQSNTTFKFGTDAVLLAEFANPHKNEVVCDLGTGTGIIPILLVAHQNEIKVTAVEIDEYIAKKAEKSIALNNLSDKIEVINEDINKLALEREKYSLVTINPPYSAKGSGIQSENQKVSNARHELTASLKDFITVGAKLLKFGGRMCMVHKPQRLSDIICFMRENKIEPKKLKLITSPNKKSPSLILIEGKKGAGVELKIIL
ncbi:MAG: methyltransferase [Clostridia bacterium]